MPYNPNNPYVINDHFFENVNNQSYDQTWTSTLNRLENLLATFLGISSSLLLMYLVLKQTPRQFKDFGRLILLCAALDFIYTVINFLAQLRFRVVEDAFMATITGPVSYLSYSYQCLFFVLTGTALTATFLLLPYEYFYRYWTIKYKSPPSFLKNVIYSLFSFFIISLHIFLTFKAYCMLDESVGYFDYAGWWYQETPTPTLIVGINTNIYVAIPTALFTSLYLVCYSFAILFGYLSTRQLRRHALRFSSKTFALQRQYGRALFGQTMLPLIQTILPMLLSVLSMKFNWNLDTGKVMILSITWYPFLNSLSNLIFIKSYRTYCTNLFMNLFKKSVRNTNITSVIPAHASTSAAAISNNQVN